MSDETKPDVSVCDGCGSTKTLEELRAAGHLSCCPERKMLSASEWKSRADNAEDEITRLRADLAAVTEERDRMRYVADKAIDAINDFSRIFGVSKEFFQNLEEMWIKHNNSQNDN